MKKVSSKDREKDPEREISDKKRRKTSTTEPGSSNSNSSRSAREDIYAVTYFGDSKFPNHNQKNMFVLRVSSSWRNKRRRVV